ncbi:MAG: GntR family transcriptional regulator [Anaerolineales bacterium]
MIYPDPETSLAHQAYQRLQQEILTCVLVPGQVVSERELARKYEVSKTPMREALSQACHQGLVLRLPGRGYLVAPITIKDIRALFDLRLILETVAVERAAQQPSSALIVGLREMSAVKYELDEPESHIYFLETNRAFHLTLAEAAGNPRLLALMSDLFDELERLFHLGLRLRDSSEEMRSEHQALVAALENGDQVAARQAITEQILSSRERILEAILQGDFDSIQIG